ncbi:hypothetical protein D8682_04970 [Buttiauxella sp. 3AFRM03]|uniref:phage tail-collar fiber domain-containing protein n=1 Tax=Buttiauxella sp. 3AFRM03 TaxID=2479367 RepID=UPI000EF79B5E|nr:phage tail protein [Buttiauxella sp. 3AFRM03]AYN26407.1 hypothetical protein D8682_04970 [Buttiauxella sp. 3AFRM03]
MSEYYSIITDAGAALEAAAIAGGPPVVLTQFAAGDGGGFPVAPMPPQVALVNEVYRGNLSSLTVGEQPNVMVAQGIIPKESGGYTVREIGIFTQEGILYSVSNYPDQIKPAPDSGYAAKLEIRYSLAVSGTEDITLLLKPGDYLTEERANTLYPRTVNSHSPDSAGAINVTTIDIFRDQAIQIGDAVDLNTLVEPGLYYQPLILQAQTGANYPEPTAGSLEILKHAGITQVFRVYAGSRSYSRSFSEGVWSGWSLAFNAENPPTAGGINAVAKTGDTMTGALGMEFNTTGWPGGGAAADQLTNEVAPIFTHVYSAGGNMYLPLTKAVVQTAGIGYLASSDFGVFVDGGNKWPSPCINSVNDRGEVHQWIFDPNLAAGSNSTRFTSNGNILGAVFRGSNLVIHLDSLVNDIQFGAMRWQDYAGGGQVIAGSGEVLCGLQEQQDDNEIHGYWFKPQQKFINGTWINVIG